MRRQRYALMHDYPARDVSIEERWYEFGTGHGQQTIVDSQGVCRRPSHWHGPDPPVILPGREIALVAHERRKRSVRTEDRHRLAGAGGTQEPGHDPVHRQMVWSDQGLQTLE